jgi:glycosyltransferase involved in cell wall biosynthesis
MRISLVGPGKAPVPPPARGGIENTLWEYQQELTRLGCEVQILNVARPVPELAAIINDFNPDFVNVHWEPFYSIHRLLPGRIIAFTTHHCSAGLTAQSLDGIDKDELTRQIPGPWSEFPHYIFTLAIASRFNFVNWGFPADRLHVTPTGANSARFRFAPFPKYPERSICVGAISPRKNQPWVQQLNAGVYFVGAPTPNTGGFDFNSKSYLGEWPRERLDNELTDYANLVLLSDREGAPAVCVEALMAGLGLVVSERAAANLDLSLPFIDLVPISQLADTAYVAAVIERNRATSLKFRREIRDYAEQNFDWPKLVRRYFRLVTNKLLRDLLPTAESTHPGRAERKSRLPRLEDVLGVTTI